MTFQILFLLACIAVVLCGVGGYRLGLHDGMGARDGKPPMPLLRARASKTRVEADKRLSMQMANIDSYDGTERGQVDLG